MPNFVSEIKYNYEDSPNNLLVIIVLSSYLIFISTEYCSGIELSKNGSAQSCPFRRYDFYDYVLINDEGVDLHDVIFKMIVSGQ